MNFVAEILSSAEKVEIENLNKKIPDILSAIGGYKQAVLQYIDEVYNKCIERSKSNTVLLSKTKSLTKDILQVETAVNSINNDTIVTKNNITSYKEQLDKSKHSLELISTLIHIHETLIKVKSCLQSRQHFEGIKQVEEVEHHQDYSELVEIEAFNKLMHNLFMVKRNLTDQLIKEFEKYVQYGGDNPVTLVLRKNMNCKEMFMAIGLAKLDLIDKFTSFLWENIINLIVNYKITINSIEDDKLCELVINISENKTENYKEVFVSLLMIVKFLNMHFNYMLDNDLSVVSYIGNLIQDNLCDLLIKNCLSETIPSNSDELQRYKIVKEDTECFHKELVKYGFFSENKTVILDYVNNVDVLFINKKCEEYLTAAKEIMKRDLHDMVEVGVSDNETNLLANSPDLFPHCFISKSTLDLIDLTQKIMQNAVTSEVGAIKLYSTVQNIFDIYGAIVQEHHQKLLQTIPQQVALFHNNCMFLSCKLSTWTEIYQELPPVISGELPPLMAKAHLLKQIGNKAFVDNVQQQIKQIEDIMKESGLNSITTLEKLEPVTEKTIRQCLRQQELLRTVWHKVLSHSDYNKSIGYILNFLCNYIINELLKVEDISSDAGDQLVDIFKVILIRGPKLFIDSKEIHLYVKSWYRFNELVFVLSSSLVEICDRWADGKGPLALQFKPEEIQKLIGALFQNTDRRAAVLARIVK